MELLVEGINEFSLDLFAKLYSARSDDSENLIFSSFSILVALAMTLAGSDGQTKAEILKSFRIESYLSNKTESIDENLLLLHENINNLANSITEKTQYATNDANKLIVANKLILNNQNIEESYRHLIENFYKAKIDSPIPNKVSFDDIITETNKWISDLTNNKLNNVLGPDFRSASVCLINLIYFNYEWSRKFDPDLTTQENFYLDRTKDRFVQVNMMKMFDEKFPYVFSEKLNSHLLSLPYVSQKFLFTVILPNNENDYLLKDDKDSLVNRLNFKDLNDDIKKQHIASVNLDIPRFKIKNDLNLNDVLKSLGIRNAFDRLSADFSKINKLEPFFIDKIIQQAYIDVNEKGTEAAAVTVVKLVKRSISHPLNIKLNRPFVYLITEKSSGLIIFLGTFNGNGYSNVHENEKPLDKDEL